MKQGKKKSGRDETREESPESDSVGSDNRNNPNGIDGIKALMILAGGIAALAVIWIILHNILHII